MKARQSPNPLLGFGPAGWIGSGILLALAVAALAGLDLQSRYIYLAGAVVGGDNIGSYMAWVHIPIALSLWQMKFNLISLAYIIPALFVFPIPRRWWQYSLVVAWMVVCASWLWYAAMLPLTAMLDASGISTAAWWSSASGWTVLDAVACLPTSIVFLIATGSWRVAIAIALVGIGLLGTKGIAESWGLLATQRDWTFGLVFWHAAIAAVLWTWALSARLRQVPEHACFQCGYNLQSGGGLRCPECGASQGAT